MREKEVTAESWVVEGAVDTGACSVCCDSYAAVLAAAVRPTEGTEFDCLSCEVTRARTFVAQSVWLRRYYLCELPAAPLNDGSIVGVRDWGLASTGTARVRELKHGLGVSWEFPRGAFLDLRSLTVETR